MEQKKVLEELEVKTAVLCAPEEREHLLRSIGKDRLRSFAGRTNLIKDFDLKGTRLYFSTHLDRLGRVMFLFALVASAFTFLFISGFLAAFLLQATNFSPVLNPIANPLFRFFTLLGCVLA